LCTRLAAGIDPLDGLQHLFRVFKAIQIGVLVWWCLWWGDGQLRFPPNAFAFAVGLLMMGVGQCLNIAVFHRLGRVGVFYGVRFGYEVPCCTSFPFSVMRHPQYIGTLLSIWGFFLLARYPAPDWLILPLLESVYYALGARFEIDGGGHRGNRAARAHAPAAGGSLVSAVIACLAKRGDRRRRSVDLRGHVRRRVAG
jgi:methylene-fatty-acyl-phospholipid synthase